MDSLDLPVSEESSVDDHHKRLPAMQGVSDPVVGTVRGSASYRARIVADCGILDACGMAYKPMGQRNTNPIGSETDDQAGPHLCVVGGMESLGSLGLPAMQ
eukprot:11278929-Karenia_brevis.AAC.1